MARKKQEVPFRVQRVVSKCKLGEKLCVGLRHSEAGLERSYWFEPSGKNAPPKSSEQAISMGLLIPNGDGLFGDSQTYRAAG
jgi:hypothetical protein